jgi:hypothetical protein
MEIDVTKNPVYLNTWIVAVPSESDPAWRAYSVWGGSRDAVETYAAEAARIRASDLSEFVNPAARKLAALQQFARTLLDARAARYLPLLDAVKANIATNQTALESKSKAGTDPVRTAAIWQYLAAQDADGLQRKIERAVRAGDRETIAATLSAPLVFNFIPNGSDRTRIADAFLRTVDEAAYDRLVDLRASFDIASGAWTRAQSYIRADARLTGIESVGA